MRQKQIIITTALLLVLAAAGYFYSTSSASSPAAPEQTAAATATLTETYWKLTELMGKPVPSLPNEAHIILKDDGGRVAGSGGCNRITGGYELQEPNRIKFGKMAATMMACMEGMDVEREFLDILGRVDSYALTGTTLQLHRARMAPLAKFEAVYLK